MRSSVIGRARGLAIAAAIAIGVAGTTLIATQAQAATSVRVASQITAHNLPYLNSPYVTDSTLAAGQYAPVECVTRGREYVGNTVNWYRINTIYYPAYAFASTTNIPPCGVSTSVPLAANGYSSPTFTAPAAEGWFNSNESVKVLCTAAGQTHDGSNAWFFTKGYWLHSTRLANHPNGNGYSTCRGYSRPSLPTVTATINAASSMLGRYPYSWGGGNKYGPSYGICCSPSGRDGTNVYGFDCSGLTQFAFYKGAGIDIGSTSRTQYANGYKVALSQRKAGDLIFWSDSSLSSSSIHHVAIYVGDGQIIEATPASGDDIRKRNFSTGETGVMPYVVRPIR